MRSKQCMPFFLIPLLPYVPYCMGCLAWQVATEIFVSTLWYPRMKINATTTASRGKMRVEYAPHASLGGGGGAGVDGTGAAGGRVLVYPAGGVVAGTRVVVTIVSSDGV
jgi:hypothetical protein